MVNRFCPAELQAEMYEYHVAIESKDWDQLNGSNKSVSWNKNQILGFLNNCFFWYSFGVELQCV